MPVDAAAAAAVDVESPPSKRTTNRPPFSDAALTGHRREGKTRRRCVGFPAGPLNLYLIRMTVLLLCGRGALLHSDMQWLFSSLCCFLVPPDSSLPPQVDVDIDIKHYHGPLRDWIAEERVSREVKKRFLKFLRTFTDESGELVYVQRVTDMCRGTLVPCWHSLSGSRYLQAILCAVG